MKTGEEDERGKSIQTFTDLLAWKEGHKVVLGIYLATKKFPKEELYALGDQMRRSAVSITSNLAEGFSRNSYKEKCQFYFISRGSATELENQLIVARDVGYMGNSEFTRLIDQLIVTHKIINGLIKKTKSFILTSNL